MDPLDALLAARDPWSLIQQIVEAPPDNILHAAAGRFERARGEERRRLALLVERLHVPGAVELLAAWLRASEPEDAAVLLRALNHRGSPVARADLDHWLASPDTATLEAAVAAAGACGDASIAPLVAVHLDDARIAMHAAIAIGRLGVKTYTPAILDRLPAQRGLTFTGFVVALELLNDATAIDPLRALLARTPADGTWDIHHALVRLSGREPVVPLARDRESTARAMREAWAALDLSRAPEPRFDAIEVRGRSEIAFTLHDASGRARIDYDAPTPGSSWPRWSKSLFIGDRRIYDVGSGCGTCETYLRLIGWPEWRAEADAEAVRRALAHIEAVSADLLEALRPLLTALRPGHYVMKLVDLDLDTVNDAASSWWRRRGEFRRNEDGDLDADVDFDWPGTAHYQLRAPIAGKVPTFGMLLPSQDPARLSAGTVDVHQAAIEGGAHPACIALSWVESKEVHCDHPERFLLGVVLDGHHKLAAYVRARTPARVLLVCRVEDTWGPPDDRARWFREVSSAASSADGSSR